MMMSSTELKTVKQSHHGSTNNPMMMMQSQHQSTHAAHESDEELGENISNSIVEVEERSFHIQSISSSQRGSNNTTGTILLSSIREVITHNPHIYRFSCLTGIIIPESFENISNSFSKHNLRYRIWGVYLRVCLFLTTLILIILGSWWLSVSEDDGDVIAFILCLTYGIAFQNILLYPAIIYLRREIDAKREDVNRFVYEEAFNYALTVGYQVGILLFILLFIFFAAQIAQSNKVQASGSLITFYIVLELFIFSPCNLLLTGVFTFLVMEQRISYFTMNAVKDRTENKTLTDGQYLQARESIQNREKVTPINWLLSDAVISTLFGIIFIFLVSRFEVNSLDSFVSVLYVFSVYGRQTLVLVLFLLEVAKVNEIQEIMIHHLAKTRWIGDETKRLNLYLVMKELPMGSSVFFYRPTKNELLIQIASTIVGIGFAVFWAIVFA